MERTLYFEISSSVFVFLHTLPSQQGETNWWKLWNWFKHFPKRVIISGFHLKFEDLNNDCVLS